jgi:hypothetical protein
MTARKPDDDKTAWTVTPRQVGSVLVVAILGVALGIANIYRTLDRYRGVEAAEDQRVVEKTEAGQAVMTSIIHVRTRIAVLGSQVDEIHRRLDILDKQHDELYRRKRVERTYPPMNLEKPHGNRAETQSRVSEVSSGRAPGHR